MPRLLLALLMGLGLGSCQKFQSPFSGVARECGLSAQPGTVVQVLGTDGQPLPATANNVEARWTSAAGEAENLTLNQAGCVRLPEEQGVIEVSTRLPPAALRHAFPSQGRAGFTRLAMIPTPQLSITSRCSDAVIFASNQLFFPYSASKAGDFSNVAMTLLATGQHVLWEKSWGEADFNFPENVDLGSLKEGSYDLQLAWQELSQDAGQTLSSICKIKILRKAPVLDGFPLVTNPSPQPIAQNSILPWVSKNPEDALWLCRRNLAKEAEEYCQKPEHFAPVQLIVTDQAGLWEYCLIAEDKAGNRSPPHCRKFLVSATAPTLDVAWVDKALQGRLPLLKRPYAQLQARINVSHPLLGIDELKNKLQCKVSLTIGSNIEATGSSVFCAKGSCAGQDLSEFRSCPTTLTLDLRSLWSQTLQRHSRLQVTVRADDGAGQISEAKTSVWIHDQAWYAEPLSQGNMGVSPDEIPVAVRHDAKGRPWLLTRLNDEQLLVYVQDGGRWRRTLDLSESDFFVFNELDLISDASGDLYLAGMTFFDKRLLLYRLNADETWSSMPAPYEGFSEECLRFVGLQPSGIACLTPTHLYSWQNSVWSALDRPAACTELDRAVVVDEERVWTACGGIMYMQRAGGLWEKKATAGIDVVEVFRLDAKGRLWAQALSPYYQNIGLGYFTRDGQWHFTGPEQGLPASIADRMLTFGRNQRIYFGPFIWDEETLRWDLIRVDDQTVFDLSAETLQGLQNRAWMAINNQSSLLEADEEQPMVWHLPSEGMARANAISFKDQQDQFWWFLRNAALNRQDIFRLRDSRFLLWDERFAGMNIQGDSFINDMKMDAKGQLWLLRSGRLFRYEDGQWRFQANFSAPVPSHILPSASGRLFLGAPGSVYEWTSEGARLIHTVPGTQLYFSQLAEDGDGSLWFRNSTSVGGDVHRLQGNEWKTFVAPTILGESFLNARLFTDRGRLVMLLGSHFLVFDKEEAKFVSMDPEDLGLPPGLVYGVYPLNAEETLVQALHTDEGPQAFRLISRLNKAPAVLPLLPENRFIQGFIKDIDARLWGLDKQGELFRLQADGTWESWIKEPEILSRLKIDSLGASRMVPTAEGGIFLQQASVPLLRILP